MMIRGHYNAHLSPLHLAHMILSTPHKPNIALRYGRDVVAYVDKIISYWQSISQTPMGQRADLLKEVNLFNKLAHF